MSAARLCHHGLDLVWKFDNFPPAPAVHDARTDDLNFSSADKDSAADSMGKELQGPRVAAFELAMRDEPIVESKCRHSIAVRLSDEPLEATILYSPSTASIKQLHNILGGLGIACSSFTPGQGALHACRMRHSHKIRRITLSSGTDTPHSGTLE